MNKRRGFTLVELLVVIGIIALLISILLPSLNAARAAANNVKDLSNLRQLANAAAMQMAERRTLQPVGSTDTFKLIDPTHRKYLWSDNLNTSSADKQLPTSWASALLPYLSNGKAKEFNGNLYEYPVFRCPADKWQNSTDPVSSPNGYWGGYAFQSQGDGSTFVTDYAPISYGINLDIVCANYGGEARFYAPFGSSSDPQIGVYRGTKSAKYPADQPVGQALNGRLDKVQDPAEVMLFSDCGVRPYITSGDAATNQNRNDALYFTTNYMQYNGGDPGLFGTLEGVMQTSWLRGRFPLDRHDRNMKQTSGSDYTNLFDYQRPAGRLNIAFCDGHAETVSRQDFRRVRVSPFR